KRRHDCHPEVRMRLARVITCSPLLPGSLMQVGATASNPILQKVLFALGEANGFQKLVPFCSQALDDAEEGVRCGALLALSKFGPASRRAGEDILRLAIEDASDVVRVAAARALAAIDRPRLKWVATRMAAEANQRNDQAMLQHLEPLLREA